MQKPFLGRKKTVGTVTEKEVGRHSQQEIQVSERRPAAEQLVAP